MNQELNKKKAEKERMYVMFVILGVLVATLSWKITHEIVVSRGMQQYYEEKMECAESMHK